MTPITEQNHNHTCCKRITDKSLKWVGYIESWTCGKPAVYTNGSHYFCRKHSKLQRYVIREGEVGSILFRYDTEDEGRAAFLKLATPGLSLQKISPGKRRTIMNKIQKTYFMTKEEILQEAESICRNEREHVFDSKYMRGPSDILALVDKAILSGYRPEAADEPASTGQEKTILEWFETIPDPIIREKAIRNYNPKYNATEVTWSLYRALLIGFGWRDTPEGFEYWNTYHNSL